MSRFLWIKNPRLLPFFLAIFIIFSYALYGSYSFFSMRHTVSLYKDNPTAPAVLVVKMEGGYNVILVKDIVDSTATCLQLSKLVESKSDAHIYLLTVKDGVRQSLSPSPLTVSVDAVRKMNIVEVDSL